eukprot:GHVT01007119.1.p1 GENE.GHVT01007119.1~~GHVT01007119.1.p1  ORF type:complete len:181 (-),score=16.04 GHVT01007119.1:1479-2021(-)
MATPWNHKQACEWELCPGSLCVVDGWTTESSCVFCSNRGACRWPGKTDGPSDDASPYPTPKCDCYEGYAGPDCSEVRCRNNCSGTATQHRGDCIASFPVHYCECLAGFGGDDCSVVAIEICESSCNRDTGTCNENGQCTCQEGFGGVWCDRREEERSAGVRLCTSTWLSLLLVGLHFLTA